MIKLPAVFSDNALYQQRSELNIHGYAKEGAELSAMLVDSKGNVYSSNKTVVNSEGRFEISISTPPASFKQYRLVLNDGEDYCIENILFGELWLAAGQSNMEFKHNNMPGSREYISKLAGKVIRFYKQNELGEGDAYGPFPFDPSEELPGVWADIENIDALMDVSAIATAFSNWVYEAANKHGDVPVGFVNCNMGASSIECWLPRESIMDNPDLYEHMKKRDRLPTREKWDTYNDTNFLQPCALYNQKVWPLVGIKLRGIIWYQGESNVSGDLEEAHYRRCMLTYHSLYENLFRATGARIFPMLSVLLYPFKAGESGECCMNFLNRAFTELADEYPDKFGCVPIYDLTPIWGFHEDNHPIHPANKYIVGERLGLIAVNRCYGGSGQKSAPSLDSMERQGNRLIIKLKNTGSGVEIRGKTLRGAYICSGNNVYVAAQGEVISPDTIALWHPYVDKPCHAAYQYSSAQIDGNLYAGELPVAPFATDTKNRITIEQKPWLNAENQSVWVFNIKDYYLDVFYRPVWFACPGSEICPDTAFTLSGTSLRIAGESNIIGAYVKSYIDCALDLQNYSALYFDVYNNKNIDCQIELQTVVRGFNRITAIDAVRIEKKEYGWARYKVVFENLPEEKIERITFRFNMYDNNYRFVNIDNLILQPR
ncbi:MAG TPA: sialate O-acetylesterase [Clostridia bacterium]|nr:sialate O-acetylesterase [Clostridia bacterium]